MGSSTGNTSRRSGSTQRSDLNQVRSLNGKQCTMAAETSTKRREPPPASRGTSRERSFQHEVDEGTAQIAVFPQSIATEAQRGRRQSQPLLQCNENVTPAGMHDPTGNRVCCQIVTCEGHRQGFFGVLCRQLWNGSCEDVAQQAVSMFKPEGFALRRFDDGASKRAT